MNIGFVSRMTRRRPWVRMKVAATLDGRTGLPSGESQWITGEEARADGHAWRARACAILTGIGTVREDDPQLTVRAVDTPRQPQRVLIDSQLDVPLSAQILDGAPPWIFCGNRRRRLSTSRRVARTRRRDRSNWPTRTARSICRRCWPCWPIAASTNCMSRRAQAERVAVARRLRRRTARLSRAEPARQRAHGMFDFAPPGTLDARPQLKFHRIDRLGDDLRILGALRADTRRRPHPDQN